jgi:hypothetical protein
MSYDVLIPELRDDPLSLGYSAMDDSEAAAAMTAPNYTAFSPVSTRNVLRWSARHDSIHALEQGASTGPKDVRKLCKAALMMFANPHVPDFDITDPELQGMLASLVAAAVFAQEEADDLVALGTELASRAAVLGLRDAWVTNGRVAEARKEIGG